MNLGGGDGAPCMGMRRWRRRRRSPKLKRPEGRRSSPASSTATMPQVACRMSHVARTMLRAACPCCVLHVVRCMLPVPCRVAWCALHVACCMLPVPCRVLHVHVVRCMLFVACLQYRVACSILCVACCLYHFACRMHHVVCCMLMSQVAAACWHVVCCTSHGRMLRVAPQPGYREGLTSSRGATCCGAQLRTETSGRPHFPAHAHERYGARHGPLVRERLGAPA